MTTPTLISDWKSTTDPLHKESESWLVENIYGKLESPLSQERHAYYLASLQPVYAALEARMDELKGDTELKDFYDVRRHRATQMQLDLLEVENAPTGLPVESLCKRISRMQPLQLIAWSFTWHQAPLMGGIKTRGRFLAQKGGWEKLTNYFTYPEDFEQQRFKAVRTLKKQISELGKVWDTEQRSKFLRESKESFSLAMRIIGGMPDGS